MYNNTLPALASICPLDYCNSITNKLSLERPGDLGNGGRTGIICDNYIQRDIWFYQVPGVHRYVAEHTCDVCSAGCLLVAALLFLNLTVAQAHSMDSSSMPTFHVNTSIFFNQSNLRPLQVIVSFVHEP